MIDADKIKPCPFCGGKAVLWRHGLNALSIECVNYNNDFHRVYMMGTNEARLVAAWNRRAGDESGNSD